MFAHLDTRLTAVADGYQPATPAQKAREPAMRYRVENAERSIQEQEAAAAAAAAGATGDAEEGGSAFGFGAHDARWVLLLCSCSYLMIRVGVQLSHARNIRKICQEAHRLDRLILKPRLLPVTTDADHAEQMIACRRPRNIRRGMKI